MDMKVLVLYKNLNEEQKKYFMAEYNRQEKSESTSFILCALGCLGIGGVHRFYLGNMGIGILYILTAGGFFIGTLYDFVKMKDLVSEANLKIANKVIQEMEVLDIGKGKKR